MLKPFPARTLNLALALCLPLALGACGAKKPKDPCSKIEKKFKGGDASKVRTYADKFILRAQKKLLKENEGNVKLGKATKNCVAPPPPKKEKVDPNAPVKKKKKKRDKTVNLVCEVTVEYCLKN